MRNRQRWTILAGLAVVLTAGLVPNAAMAATAGGTIIDNSAGVIVGEAFLFTSSHAVRWDTNGTVTDLGSLPGSDGKSVAHSVNSAGVIVGAAYLPDGWHAVRWRTAGTITKLGDAGFFRPVFLFHGSVNDACTRRTSSCIYDSIRPVAR